MIWLILLLVLITTPILTEAQTNCYRPIFATCEQVQRIVDECLMDYVSRFPGAANLLLDFGIYLRYGESCTIDFRGNALFGGIKGIMVIAEGKNRLTLMNGAIYPLYQSAYYGLDIGAGVEQLTLINFSISGFRSGLVTGQGIAIRGDTRLITHDVRIYDNAVGIAQGYTGKSLNWISGNTIVAFNEIGLLSGRFSGAGGYTTKICLNTVDVMLIGGILDIAAKSFQADLVDPEDYSVLFDRCTPFNIVRRNVSTPKCPYLPEASARSLIMNIPKDCQILYNPNISVSYSTFTKDTGLYVLVHDYVDGEKILANSLTQGYIYDSINTSLVPGLNLFRLETLAYSSNECGTSTATDTDRACVIYIPQIQDRCEYEIDEYYLNGIPQYNQNSQITIYMRSPAYLNVSAKISGNYTECFLVMDGEIVHRIDNSTSQLVRTLQFNKPGKYSVSLFCNELKSDCAVYRTTVNVEKSGQNCKNNISISGDPGRCISYIAEELPLDVIASSFNSSSLLRLYINNQNVFTTTIAENSTYSNRFNYPLPSGRYYVYGEVISSNNYCIDSDIKCFDLINPSPKCEIDLNTNIPSGSGYEGLYNISFQSSSSNQIRCELKINSNIEYTEIGRDVGYSVERILIPGNYSFEVLCYDVQNTSCRRIYSSNLQILDRPQQCDFKVIPYLPGGEVESGRTFEYGFEVSGDVFCNLYINSIPIYSNIIRNSTFRTSDYFDAGEYNFLLNCRLNSCSETYSSNLRVRSNGTPPENRCNINLDYYLPSGTYLNNFNTSLYYSASSEQNMVCTLYQNNQIIDSRGPGKTLSFFGRFNLGLGEYLYRLSCIDERGCESRVSSYLFITNQTEIPDKCTIDIVENIPAGTYEIPVIFNYSYNITSNNTLKCIFYRNNEIFDNQTGKFISKSYINDLISEDTNLSLFCYYTEDPSCNRFINKQIYIRNQFPIPNSTCVINITESIPSGTFASEFYTNYSIYINSNPTLQCKYYINSIPIFIESTPIQKIYLNQFYGFGYYIHELKCNSNLSSDCKLDIVRAVYVRNQSPIPPSICDIRIDENIPNGQFNNTLYYNYSINITSNHSIECVYSINNNIINQSNHSIIRWNFTHLLANDTHYLYCQNPINPACNAMITRRTFVVVGNETLPPSTNISCELDFDWNLPIDRCLITDQNSYNISYRAYSSLNNTKLTIINDNRIVDRYFTNSIRGHAEATLNNGLNVFKAYIQTPEPSCRIERTGCIVKDSSNPLNCNVSTSLYLQTIDNLVLLNFSYFVDEPSECKLFINNQFSDAFITSNSSSKLYYLPNQNYVFNATCRNLWKNCQYSYVLNYVTPAGDACNINYEIIPNSSKCLVTSDQNLRFILSVNPMVNLKIFRNNQQILSLYNLSRFDQNLPLIQGINLFEFNLYNSSCSELVKLCIDRTSSDCIEGMNLSVFDNQIRIGGSRGSCVITIDGTIVDIINYTNTTSIDIQSTAREIFIHCSDALYCSKNYSYKLEDQVRLRLWLESDSYKSSESKTNLTYGLILTSNIYRNYSCNVELNNRKLKTLLVPSNTVYYDTLELGEGIYDINVKCYTGSSFINASSSLVVYYVIHNDTNSPTILLQLPKNNSVFYRLPTLFRFQVFDDVDDRLYCKFRLYKKYEDLKNGISYDTQIFNTVLYADRGRITELRYNPEEIHFDIYGMYLWNVSCIDNGDPIGHSETWIFWVVRGNDTEITNYITPNQSVYLENQTIRVYFGVEANQSLDSQIVFNNTPIYRDLLDPGVVYYLDIPGVPPGIYSVSIVSYYNDVVVQNRSQFFVVGINQSSPTTEITNYITPNQSVYLENQTIRVYFGVEANQSLDSQIVFNNTPIYRDLLDPGVVYYLDIPGVPPGIYSVSIVSYYNNTQIINSAQIIVMNVHGDLPVYQNDITPENNIFTTNQSTQVVVFNYSINSSSNGTYYSEIYLDELLVFSGNLSSNVIYNGSIELSGGVYNLTFITYVTRDVILKDQEELIINTIVEQDPNRKYQKVESIIQSGPLINYPQFISAFINIIQPPFLPILGIITISALIYLIYRRRTVRIEILNKPYVGDVVNIRIVDLSGKPQSNVKIRIYAPDGTYFESVSDTEGIIKYIPTLEGVHELIVIDRKAREPSVKILIERP